MNLLNLKYFLDIADQGSITAAARVNVVSQQSVSEHLRKLEQYYDTPLFFRTSPLSLTPAGEILYQRGKEILGIMEQTKTEIDTLSRSRSTILGLGLVLNDTPPFLDDLLLAFHRKYPSYKLHVFDNCLQEKGIPEEVDLVLAPRRPAPEWSGISLIEDRVAIAVHSRLLDSIYGARRGEVERAMREQGDAELLRDLPFVHFVPSTAPSPPAPAGSDPASLQFPNVIVRTANGGLQQKMVGSGAGATFLVADHARRTFADQPEVLIFPLSGEKNRCGCSIWFRTAIPLNPVASAFVSLAQKQLRTLHGT